MRFLPAVQYEVTVVVQNRTQQYSSSTTAKMTQQGRSVRQKNRLHDVWVGCANTGERVCVVHYLLDSTIVLL